MLAIRSQMCLAMESVRKIFVSCESEVVTYSEVAGAGVSLMSPSLMTRLECQTVTFPNSISFQLLSIWITIWPFSFPF